MIDKELLAQRFEKEFALRDTPGGHMAYDYALLEHEGEPYFIKHHDSATFTDPERETHSRLYLSKESATYDHLHEQGFVSIPRHHELLGDTTLLLEGLPPEQGWYWRAPTGNSTHDYIQDVLASLATLETIGQPENCYPITPTYLSFNEEGWSTLHFTDNGDHVRQKIREIRHQLHTKTAEAVDELGKQIEVLAMHFTQPHTSCFTAFAHHDARQTNIAWHPEHGTRIVDWSWAGAGLPKSDSTSFLIDLAKSGVDVNDYLDEYFNPDHAMTLIGFWLGHSIWPTRPGNESVRLHQIASAATAYQLLVERAA